MIILWHVTSVIRSSKIEATSLSTTESTQVKSHTNVGIQGATECSVPSGTEMTIREDIQEIEDMLAKNMAVRRNIIGDISSSSIKSHTMPSQLDKKWRLWLLHQHLALLKVILPLSKKNGIKKMRRHNLFWLIKSFQRILHVSKCISSKMIKSA